MNISELSPQEHSHEYIHDHHVEHLHIQFVKQYEGDINGFDLQHIFFYGYVNKIISYAQIMIDKLKYAQYCLCVLNKKKN